MAIHVIPGWEKWLERTAPRRYQSVKMTGPKNRSFFRQMAVEGVYDARSAQRWPSHRHAVAYNLNRARKQAQQKGGTYDSAVGRAYLGGYRTARAHGKNMGSFKTRAGGWKKGAGGRFIGSK